MPILFSKFIFELVTKFYTWRWWGEPYKVQTCIISSYQVWVGDPCKVQICIISSYLYLFCPGDKRILIDKQRLKIGMQNSHQTLRYHQPLNYAWADYDWYPTWARTIDHLINDVISTLLSYLLIMLLINDQF